MKTAQDYLDAANAVVPTMDAKEAIAKHAEGQGLFVDVRDSAEIDKSGTIAGAHRVPRGMIEFRADPAMEDLYNPIFKKIWGTPTSPTLAVSRDGKKRVARPKLNALRAWLSRMR